MSANPLDYADIIGNKLSDFKEIESIDSNGNKKNFTALGCGYFGYTEKMESKKNGQNFAIKNLNKKRINENSLEKLHFKKEVKLQEKLSHENLVKFYGYFEGKEKIQKYKEIYNEKLEIQKETMDKSIYCLILEYCPNGSLKDYVENHIEKNRDSKAPIEQSFVIKVFRDILNALIYLKSKKILHRDIKPDNILFDQNFNVKITDFGVSALYRDKKEEIDKDYENDEDNSDEDNENDIDNDLYMNNSLIGPREYAAPEILNLKKYNYSVDVYSLGMCIFYMMTADIPSYTKFIQKGKNK
jgi:serine/threonine protein kinase